MNTEKIRELCRMRGMALRKLGMMMPSRLSANGIQNILNNRSTNTRTLEEPSSVLEVNPGVFFDDHPFKMMPPDEIVRLREWIEIKDERIKMLEERLRLLDQPQKNGC